MYGPDQEIESNKRALFEALQRAQITSVVVYVSDISPYDDDGAIDVIIPLAGSEPVSLPDASIEFVFFEPYEREPRTCTLPVKSAIRQLSHALLDHTSKPGQGVTFTFDVAAQTIVIDKPVRISQDNGAWPRLTSNDNNMVLETARAGFALDMSQIFRPPANDRGRWQAGPNGETVIDEAKQAEYGALLTSAKRTNTTVLFDALERAGITHVAVRLDGIGDTFNLTGPDAISATGQTLLPTTDVEIGRLLADPPQAYKVAMPLDRAVETITCDLIDEVFGDWPVVDGITGTFEFHIEARKITLDGARILTWDVPYDNNLENQQEPARLTAIAADESLRTADEGFSQTDLFPRHGDNTGVDLTQDVGNEQTEQASLIATNRDFENEVLDRLATAEIAQACVTFDGNDESLRIELQPRSSRSSSIDDMRAIVTDEIEHLATYLLEGKSPEWSIHEDCSGSITFYTDARDIKLVLLLQQKLETPARHIRNTNTLFDALQQAGITRVTVHFDDHDGAIEFQDIFATKQNEPVPLPDQRVIIDIGSLNGTEPIRNTTTLSDAISFVSNDVFQHSRKLWTHDFHHNTALLLDSTNRSISIERSYSEEWHVEPERAQQTGRTDKAHIHDIIPHLVALNDEKLSLYCWRSDGRYYQDLARVDGAQAAARIIALVDNPTGPHGPIAKFMVTNHLDLSRFEWERDRGIVFDGLFEEQAAEQLFSRHRNSELTSTDHGLSPNGNEDAGVLIAASPALEPDPADTPTVEHLIPLNEFTSDMRRARTYIRHIARAETAREYSYDCTMNPDAIDNETLEKAIDEARAKALQKLSDLTDQQAQSVISSTLARDHDGSRFETVTLEEVREYRASRPGAYREPPQEAVLTQLDRDREYDSYEASYDAGHLEFEDGPETRNTAHDQPNRSDDIIISDRQAKEHPWDDQTVLIVPEADRATADTPAELTAKAGDAGAKVIISADPRQPYATEQDGANPRQTERTDGNDVRQAIESAAAARDQDFFNGQNTVHFAPDAHQATHALVERYIEDQRADPAARQFILTYTNEQADHINHLVREARQQQGALGPDHRIETAHGDRTFAAGDRVQFTANGSTAAQNEQGVIAGAAGTITAIDMKDGKTHVTVEPDRAKGEHGRPISFIVGADREAGEFADIRHGYAGAAYRAQGRALDQTYVYHSEEWRQARGYAVIARHSRQTNVFTSHDVVGTLTGLAAQMRVGDDVQQKEPTRSQNAGHRPSPDSRQSTPDIDFKLINQAAMSSLPDLLHRWLPDGRLRGHEYVARNPTRGDHKPGSFKINVNTGRWADFADNAKGGDLISLYAYLHGLREGEAATALVNDLGIDASRSTGTHRHATSSGPARPGPKQRQQPIDADRDRKAKIAAATARGRQRGEAAVKQVAQNARRAGRKLGISLTGVLPRRAAGAAMRALSSLASGLANAFEGILAPPSPEAIAERKAEKKAMDDAAPTKREIHAAEQQERVTIDGAELAKARQDFLQKCGRDDVRQHKLGREPERDSSHDRDRSR